MFIGILLFLFKKYLCEIYVVVCAFIYIFGSNLYFLLNAYLIVKTEIFKNKGVDFFNILNKVTDLEEVK